MSNNINLKKAESKHTIFIMKAMTSRQQNFFTQPLNHGKVPLAHICAHPEIDALVQFLQEREAASAMIYLN